jgi:hypothetical protein
MYFPIEHSLSSMDPQLWQLTPRLKLRSVDGPCLLRMTRIFTMWTIIPGLSKPRGGDAPRSPNSRECKSTNFSPFPQVGTPVSL